MATYSSFKRISNDSLVDTSIVAADLAAGAVTNGKIAANAVTGAKFATNAVGTTQLAGTVDLSAKTVTYRSIVTGDISGSAAIGGAKLASGAAVANIGYTPLANSGGTMTGTLRVPNASAATAGVNQSGATNTGIYFDTGNNVYFTTAGTQRMAINSNGHRTIGTDRTTGSVMFHAYPTGGWCYCNTWNSTGYTWTPVTSGNGWNWNNYQRGGSNFNNSSGAFTAPVSGHYHFMFQTYGHNDTASTNGYTHLSFGRNGGTAFARGQTPHGIFGHGTTNGPYPHGITMDLSTYLNAGDYVQVWNYWSANNVGRYHGNHSTFHGYLVT
jgi:hypothetical protein